MKREEFITLFLVLIMSGMVVIIVFNITLLEVFYPKPFIVIPEEWESISSNPLKPDTLTSYVRNDTIFLQFK